MQLYHVCFLIKAHPVSVVFVQLFCLLCFDDSTDTMPPKTKRQCQLECARAQKLAKSEEQSERKIESENSNNSSSDDADYDPNQSLITEEDTAIAKKYIEEWVSMLHRDDIMSLSLMLHHSFVNVCKMKKTTAAKEIGKLIGKSERTVREGRKSFYDNGG